VLRIDHIDESIANIAFVLKKGKNSTEIPFSHTDWKDYFIKYEAIVAEELNLDHLEVNWQINKIISSLMTFINSS
jgi:hypothetical protein